MNTPLKNLAIFISGSGSTMEAVHAAILNKSLAAIRSVIVISSDAGAAGLHKASTRGTPTAVIERNKFGSADEFGVAILKELKKHNVEIVAQLGWLPLTPQNVIREYGQRIFNQHPGPLDPGRPDFGGHGMYGIHVHAAVIAYQWLTGHRFPTESTTHLVTPEFDQGRLISTGQLTVRSHEHVPKEFFENPANIDILRNEAKLLQKDLLSLEHRNVIRTLQMFAHEKTEPHSRNEPLIPEANHAMLVYAKTIAQLTS